MPDQKHAGGRPRKGSLYWTKSGWRARITIDVDGVAVQKSFDLETMDKQVARIKLRRLVASLTAPEPPPPGVEAARAETFEEAAERVVGESGIGTKQARLRRLRSRVFPAFGSKPVTEVVAGDLREILTAMAAEGQSRQSCMHIKNDVSSVLGELWRNDMLPENVAAKVRIPKTAKVDRRERTVLNDDELVRYVAWEHPEEKKRPAVLERQVMACTSRIFGGLRWGDIRGLRWENFDTANGAFSKGWAPRKKTARPQALEVPAVLRPILRDWWERHGKQSSGLIFPARRGKRAGEERKAGSMARALRRDLERAFGIVVPVANATIRANKRPDSRPTWVESRPMTPRELELLEPGPFTKPVDFHSFRRAYKQALADSGMDVQASMALSGATDMAAHARYLLNTAKLQRVPDAALPSFSIVVAETPDVSAENDTETSCRRADLNRRHRAYEARALTD